MGLLVDAAFQEDHVHMHQPELLCDLVHFLFTIVNHVLERLRFGSEDVFGLDVAVDADDVYVLEGSWKLL